MWFFVVICFCSLRGGLIIWWTSLFAHLWTISDPWRYDEVTCRAVRCAVLVVKLVEERGVLVMALEDGRYNLGEEQCVLVKLGPPGRLGRR